MTWTLNASDGDADVEAEAEAKVLKQPVVRMVVEPMASTAFTSDLDE